MSETMRMWLEIGFNVSYLIVIWALVVLMVRRYGSLPADRRPVARAFIAAFGLLALGDTGHVGFRVWAYALGDLGTTLQLFGREIGLVGLGALATATTVTFFYVLMVVIWRRRFHQSYGPLAWLLFAASVVRLALMVPAANEWNSAVPPQPWSLIRNAPLVVLGMGAAYLILRDARRAGDRAFLWLGGMILVSYAFYAPVIVWVQQAPMVGMLMIPKTVAYLVMAFLGYRAIFQPERDAAHASPRPGMAADV
jgi:hypothetical protein